MTQATNGSLYGGGFALPDAAAQVFGCSFSVGDNQDLLYGQVFFKQQPQHQPADGIGFACAGTCINEVDPCQGGADEIKGGWL